MLTVKIENKIYEIFNKLKGRIRSLLLFGDSSKILFGKNVRIGGQIAFGRNISIGDHSKIIGKNIIINDDVFIHENVLIRSVDSITIGEGTTINRNCCILFKVYIGKQCSIAPNVVIVGSNHIYKDSGKVIKEQGTSIKGIFINDDVWIGANVTILDGITIGKGAVIAAGAVVNKDIPEFTVAGGVPVKIIKSRVNV